MDNDQIYGVLLMLRKSGVTFYYTEVCATIIESAFLEANKAIYALKMRSLRQFNRLLTMSQLIGPRTYI